MKKTTIISLGVGLLLVAVVFVSVAFLEGAFLLGEKEKEGKPIASTHRYVLSEQPKALTEELAMSYARQSLAQDGLNTNVWQPVHDKRLIAWGRSTDGFAVYNTNNSKYVCIAFRSGQSPTRFVSVDLLQDSLICQTSIEE